MPNKITLLIAVSIAVFMPLQSFAAESPKTTTPPKTAPKTTTAPKNAAPIKRDAFLAQAKSSVKGACKKPDSPYACMVKNPEVCEKNLPLAAEQCEKIMKSQLPLEIRPGPERRQLSGQVTRCITDRFIIISGRENIDASKCPRRN